jgi:hypothetical protein
VVGSSAPPVPVSCYIGGTSYSGSTLLSFLLDAQTNLASIGEVAWSVRRENPGLYPCSCGKTLDECEFWGRVSQEMARRGHQFDANHWDMAFEATSSSLVRPLIERHLGSNLADVVRDDIVRIFPPWRKRFEKAGMRNAAFIHSIAAITGASAFIDASKDPARAKRLRAYCAIEPRIIHLVRDSPAFVNSFLKKRNDSQRLQRGIRWWNSTAMRMESLRRTVKPESWLLVRYEDLCVTPESEITRILRFLGVSAGAPVLDFRRATHHIIGNSMRLSSSSEIRLDDSWRDELSELQLDQIIKRTKKYRRLFGYISG